MAPYAVMGGDCDDDGLLADEDDDDLQTIFQGNFMSNIAPQHHHHAFNGSGGLWFILERFVQDTLVLDRGLTVWVYAGTVFGSGPVERVGPNHDIQVPALFYKIVSWEDPDIDQPIILAFLFLHQRTSAGDI